MREIQVIHARANRVCGGSQRTGMVSRAVVCVIVATLSPSAAHAQSTWLPTSGTFSWLSSGSWSNGTVPNATGAVAVFPSAGVTVSIPTSTVTTGTIRTTHGSGNVVIGDNATTTDILNLDVASGAPAFDVGTGGTLFIYANVTGSQGFTKTGGGTLTYRFNTHDMAYSGTVALGAGTLGINQDGSLGNTSNPLSITGNSTLLIAPGSNSGTVALAAGRTMTIASGVTSAVQNNNAAQTTVFNNPIGGSGALSLITGTFALNGNNTYAGNTTLTNVNRLTLGNGSRLSSAGLTIASGSTSTIGTTLDLGGNSQSVSSLALTTGSTPVTTTFTNGSLSVTGGNIGFTSGFNGLTPSGTASVSMAGLTSFTYSNANGQFKVNPNSTSGTNVGVAVLLANAGAGVNTITGSTFQVGGAASSAGNFASTLGLGRSNAINTAEFLVGGFQGTGTVSFQSAASALVVRGTAAADTRAPLMVLGWTSSGNKPGDGTLNLSNGAVDARLTSLVVGRHGANANNTVAGSLTVSSGTLDAVTVTIGEKTVTSGSLTSTATVTQSGGLVQAGTIRFGDIQATTNATPTFNATYTLSSGTLAAGLITSQGSVAGAVASTAGSTRRLSWSGGTISNFDGATDLVVSGSSTNAGYVMQVVLAGTAAKTLSASAGRSITFDGNTLISSTGSLTAAGPGTVVIGGSNSYSGGTVLSAGTLRAGHANAFGTGAVVVGGGATLNLDSRSIANSITNNGGSVINAANYAGTQTLTGTATIGDLDGTLVVANGAAATFNGWLGAATTIDAGGSATLTNDGLISRSSLVNNGTLTIDRTGSTALATAFSGNGALVKTGVGTVSLSGSSSLSGATQINAGDLRVDGALAGGVAVASTGLLGGSGIVGAISGAGLVGPGNSPGILTSTGSLDPSGGLDFSFEFGGTSPTWSAASASVNDVLHLTAATPLTAALGGSNTVNVYLNAGTLTAGNTFLGGIFIDQPQGTLDLASLVAGAAFEYFVAGGSDVTYNGVGYSTLANYMAANPGVTGISAGTATVASADFATGTVTNGQAMQFAIVPEPGAMVLIATGALAAGWTFIQRAGRMRARAASSHWRHG